jgi:hypothetical protein
LLDGAIHDARYPPVACFSLETVRVVTRGPHGLSSTLDGTGNARYSRKVRLDAGRGQEPQSIHLGCRR